MLNQFVSLLKAEWDTVTNAPWTFAFFVLICILVAYRLAAWYLGGKAQNLDAEIKRLEKKLNAPSVQPHVYSEPEQRNNAADDPSYDEIRAVFPIGPKGSKLPFRCSLRDPELGGLPPQTLRRYAYSSEVIGLIQIARVLGLAGIELDTTHFYDTPRVPNLLVVGGDENNPVSLPTIGDLGHFKFEKRADRHACFRNWKTGEQFECSETPSGGKVRVDYGIIVRKTFRDERQSILLLAGIHMHGTLGAIEVALKREFMRRVINAKASSFVQLVKVSAVAGDGMTVFTSPDALEWREEWFSSVDHIGARQAKSS